MKDDKMGDLEQCRLLPVCNVRKLIVIHICL